LPGDVIPVNIANKLGIPPSDVLSKMQKKEGETIKKDEPLAMSQSFFGVFKNTVKSPITGTVENISSITGQVLLREPPVPITVKAFIDGVVSKVYENEGVEIENKSAYIQGIFGIGGEITGEIKVLVDAPDAELMPEQIDNSCKDKIIVVVLLYVYQLLKKLSRSMLKVLLSAVSTIRILRICWVMISVWQLQGMKRSV